MNDPEINKIKERIIRDIAIYTELPDSIVKFLEKTCTSPNCNELSINNT